MAGGRPTDYTPEKADIICAMIAQGCSIRTICKEEGMPSIQTFFTWLRTHKVFLEQYTRAKEEQAEALTEEILDISDNGTNDWMERNDKDGTNLGWVVNGEHIQRSRLRVESRKWLASKLKPKKYGDSTTIKGDKDNPLTVKNVNDAELESRLTQLLGKAGVAGTAGTETKTPEEE